MTLADGRNIVLIIYLIPAMLIVLAPGVLLFFAIKGLRILKRKIVPYAHQIRFYFQRIERATERVSQTVTKPIIVTAGAAERLKFYWNRMTNILRNQEE